MKLLETMIPATTCFSASADVGGENSKLNGKFSPHGCIPNNTDVWIKLNKNPRLQVEQWKFRGGESLSDNGIKTLSKGKVQKKETKTYLKNLEKEMKNQKDLTVHCYKEEKQKMKELQAHLKSNRHESMKKSNRRLYAWKRSSANQAEVIVMDTRIGDFRRVYKSGRFELGKFSFNKETGSILEDLENHHPHWNKIKEKYPNACTEAENKAKRARSKIHEIVHGVVDPIRYRLTPVLHQPPNHVVVDLKSWDDAWEQTSGRLFVNSHWDLKIPEEIATDKTLAYYGASFIKKGSHCRLTFHSVNKISYQDFNYSHKYLDDYVLPTGGCGIEVHDFPHFETNMVEDVNKSGWLVLGKRVKNTLHMTAFRIPYMYTVYLPPFTLHSNDLMLGKWRTLLAWEAQNPIDHVRFRLGNSDRPLKLLVSDDGSYPNDQPPLVALH